MTDMMLLSAEYLRFTDLGLSPIIAEIGPVVLRWYSMAYLVGIIGGYFLLRKMLGRPGAPMGVYHLDDLLLWATLGVIGGGRIGYALFYDQSLLSIPEIFQLWNGGMSFHGGALGLFLAGYLYARSKGLAGLRIADYLACVAPLGQMLGRIANFINGELYGRATDVSWAIIFPGGGDVPRHPSQLYAAFFEGFLTLVILQLLFWKTRARHYPGLLLGIGVLLYGAARFGGEFFRAPDQQLADLVRDTGLSMGQWLTVPMILIGVWLVATASRRRGNAAPRSTREDLG